MEKRGTKCSTCSKCQTSVTESYTLRSDFSQEIFGAHYTESVLSLNDSLVCKTPYGLDILRVMGLKGCCKQESIEVVRQASEEDLIKAKNLDQKANAAKLIFREKVAARPDLEMKLVAAHVLLDSSKTIFLFTAEERVDFRDLVKDLSSQLQSRVELWQINSREETRVIGGLGVCGREYCCRNMGHDIGSISMKMVKDQFLSPNSSKLSGACGRLFCCLSYEHQQYVDERKNLPKLGAAVLMNGQKWFIKEINVLARRLTLSGQEGNGVTITADDLADYDNEQKAWKTIIKEPDF